MLRSTPSRRLLSTTLKATSSTTTTTTKSGLRLAINRRPATFFTASSSQSNSSNTTNANVTRSLSSFAEPGTLFNSDMMENMKTKDGDKDAPLRADIRAMGSILGQIVREHHGEDIFQKIEELRGLSKEWRTAGAGRKPETAEDADNFFAELTKACAKLSNEEILIISRAFNGFLSIANAGESHHRIRRLNMATREEALPDRYDSW